MSQPLDEAIDEQEAGGETLLAVNDFLPRQSITVDSCFSRAIDCLENNCSGVVVPGTEEVEVIPEVLQLLGFPSVWSLVIGYLEESLRDHLRQRQAHVLGHHQLQSRYSVSTIRNGRPICLPEIPVIVEGLGRFSNGAMWHCSNSTAETSSMFA